MILKSLLGSWRSLERPSTPLSDPDEWLVEDLGGGTTSAGVRVNEEIALTDAALFRGVMLIAGDVAKLPLFLYRRLPGGGKERATRHPAYSLLRWKPNPWQHALVFKMLLQSHALLRGNGYALIERNGAGLPGALLPLHPGRCRPVRVEGSVWYLIDVRSTGETVRVPWSDVFHLRGLPSTESDGLAGVSVLQKARESLGVGLAARDYGARFFSNDAVPRAVIEHPGRLGAVAKDHLVETWEKAHRGVSNKHRVAILEEGMKLHPFSLSPEDAQLLQLRQFEVREKANWLGLPPHKLGDSSRTSYNSLEQENQSYLDTTLDNWLVAWEYESRDKLLSERQQLADSHVFEFLRAALVRTDLRTRTDSYARAILTGWLSRDDVRELESLGPIPGGLGKQYFVPSNVRVAGENGGKSGSPAGAPGVVGQEAETGEADPGEAPAAQGPPAGDPPVDGTARAAARAEVLGNALRSIARRWASVAAKRLRKAHPPAKAASGEIVGALRTKCAASEPPALPGFLSDVSAEALQPASRVLGPILLASGLEHLDALETVGRLLERLEQAPREDLRAEADRVAAAVTRELLEGGDDGEPGVAAPNPPRAPPSLGGTSHA